MSKLLIIHFILFFLHANAFAQQADTANINLYGIPKKYISGLDKKIDRYSSLIAAKTQKTLARLSRWENKIHGLLQKVNPEAVERLFGNNQITFTSLLQKIMQAEALALSYQQPYDKYRDKVTTSLKYLATQKEQLDSNVIKKIKATTSNLEELAIEEGRSAVLQQFIKERKKQLAEQAFQYVGKNRYLAKINKEAWYYIETMANYKELFSDSKKSEATAISILNKIPAFQQFFRKNSLLSSLFSQPDDIPDVAIPAVLQTRAGVQDLIQDHIASGGKNSLQQIQQNIQEAKNQVNLLKEKMLSNLSGGSSSGMPEFKPNLQKTKTILQRLEYGCNLQFSKNNILLPSTSEIALSVGYKINDKSVIGIGASYKLGMGSIQHIHITHQGIGLRTFVDWKLKKQFFLSGGYESNHNAQFKNIEQLKSFNAWQRSGLIGITKKLNIKTRWFKGTKIQVLYDFLCRQHVPVSQPVLFRVGYTF